MEVPLYLYPMEYKIYFVYSNKPDALFQGDDFVLNSNGIEIQIVKGRKWGQVCP